GIPVVAMAAIAESSPIKHGINGLIAESGHEFAEHILNLLENPARAQEIGLAAQETIQKEFSQDYLISTLGEAIQHIKLQREKKLSPNGISIREIENKEMESLPPAPEVGLGALFVGGSVGENTSSNGEPRVAKLSITVGFDLAVLGLGHAIERARTGVFRVAEQTAIALANQHNCTLAPAAIRHYSQSVNYWLSNNPLWDLASWDYDQTLHDLAHPLQELHQTVAQYCQSSSTPNGLVHLESLLRQANQIVDGAPYPIDKNWLNSLDIFYSPYYPIPPEISNNNIPHLLTVHDLIPIKFPDWFEWNEGDRIAETIRSVGKNGAYLCVSESTRRDLLEFLGHDIDPNRVQVTPLAANAKLFYPCSNEAKWNSVRENYKLPKNPYFLSLCTLEPRKNTELVIRAFGKLIQEEKIQNLSLVLVGSVGWKYEAITEALRRSGVHRDRIVLTGFVNDDDLASIYSHALGFIYPSRYEGFGLPPLEAMQCGTPVITSNQSSLPEVVGSAGVLIDADDCDGLSQAMWAWYNRPQEREYFAQLALAQAKQFTWERYAQ
ncbi:MAG: glycosyltransferase, partial [Cyanobacteria bacterium P01_F01_bin.153]